MFENRKAEERKRFPLLVSAFVAEFSEAERSSGAVLLRIVSRGLDLGELLSNVAGVELIDYVPQREFAALYRNADAFVLPSAGEGWGRPTAEAMASRLPVIVTGWGGTTEFARPENAFLIDYDLEEIVDGPFAGHKWALPRKQHLRELMRLVATDDALRLQKAGEIYFVLSLCSQNYMSIPVIIENGYNTIRNEFSFEHIRDSVIAELRSLLAKEKTNHSEL